MSGFIVVYNTDRKLIDRNLLSSLVKTLKFRGPDKQAIWIDKNIGMGHALLKTTFEAEYENQPASIDNKVWITCSARIDDRENLVNKLGMKNKIKLNTTPDSELILHAYNKWGEGCLDHLLGDFAFVIWDSKKEKLFCAKDRFNMKQLYYAEKNNTIIIGNSLGCMLKHPLIKKELNEKAIGGSLLFGAYTWMDKSVTMFKDVSILLPAHKLIIENGNITIQKYWEISSNTTLLHYKNDQDYVEHFLDLFKTAVFDRMRTSSITISMSGGMDSSSIAAIAKQIQKENNISNIQINAVTSIYEDHILNSKEEYYANTVAKYIDIPIHCIKGDDYPFLRPILKTTHPCELAQPLYWQEFHRKLAETSRVTLLGGAADQLLEYPSTAIAYQEIGMYGILKNSIVLNRLYNKKLPLGIGLRTKLKKLFLSNSEKGKYAYPLWINENFEKKLGLRNEWNQRWNSLHEEQSIRTKKSVLEWSLLKPDWNTDDLLMESDFTFPEIRDPYLDLRLVEFILRLPTLPWLFNKHILRASMKGILPDEIIYRPKVPLGDLHHALAIKSKNKWLPLWKPSELSSNYIKKDFSFHFSNQPTDYYLNSRPILLDEWLKSIN